MSVRHQRVDYVKDLRCSKMQRTLNRLYNHLINIYSPVKYLTLTNFSYTRDHVILTFLKHNLLLIFQKFYLKIILNHFPLIALFNKFFCYVFDRLRNMQITIKYRKIPFSYHLPSPTYFHNFETHNFSYEKHYY